MQRLWIASLAALTFGASGQAQTIPLPDLPEAQKAELAGYLTEHWMTPEDYVVSKFKDHDIVFVGEWHRIKHDVQLIQKLIPELYAAGVYNLGIEFGLHEDQALSDSLVTAPEYDPAIARRMLFRQYSMWGFIEYEDLYRKAWELNHSLSADAPKFRIVNLNYQARWDLLKEEMTSEDWHRVWCKGDYDAHMASVIRSEIIEKGEKALIYSGSHHAFTRYHQPYWDDSTRTFAGLNKSRMGNIVYDSIPDRVFNISLHFPWMQWQNMSAGFYPVGGAIDAAMMQFSDKRVGFDVVGTPFGALRDSSTYYAVGHDDFSLRDLCDGYIYQGPFEEFAGVTIDAEFVTDANLSEAVLWSTELSLRTEISSSSEFVERIRESADIPRVIREKMGKASAAPSPPPDRIPLPDVPDPLKLELTGYLAEHWQSPEDYVVSKFADRDIVFLGGWSRVKHDVELVQRLIPLLYVAGVRHLGVTFGSYESQSAVDSLLNSPIYREDVARQLIFFQVPFWAYKEYQDIYRAAWEFNHALPPEAPKFRIVHLNYRPHWELAKVEMTQVDSQNVWNRGPQREFMARVVLDEFVKHDCKALVFGDARNTITRYRWPQLDPGTGEVTGHGPREMGNIVSDSIPALVFSINMHWPWVQRTDSRSFSYPVGGVIDAVMRELETPRVGFDVAGSPFATLVDSTSIFAPGYTPFVLADFCDGYICQGAISGYESCTIDTLFITDFNLTEAIERFPNVAMRQNLHTPREILGIARDDADLERRWAGLR